MEIKKHTLFRFNSLLWGDYIWGCVSILPTLVCARAVYYNHVVLKTPLATGAWVTMLATLATFWAITIYRYRQRARFIKSIIFYTRQGLAVSVTRPQALERIQHYPPAVFTTMVADAIDVALEFFAKQSPTLTNTVVTKDELAKALNGGVLTITDAPFSANSSHGPMPPNFPQKLMGLNFLDQFVIAWDGDRVKTVDQLMALLQHEVGHFALFQLGINDLTGGSSHHQVMQRVGFPH